MRRVGATIKGFGEYKIGSNTILGGGMSPPMITNSVSNGAVILRHREYIRDIQSSQDFSNLVFPLNPGIQSTFPWLAQIAPSFEQYRFRGIVFEFKSNSADVVLSGAASTALGTVVMATQYDALDPPFDNKFEMSNWEFTTSQKPSRSFMHPVECAKSQTPLTMLYIRTGDPPGNSDLRLYDLGNFNIAVVGMQNVAGENETSTIGELWVSYEVEFYKPKLEEDATTEYAHWTPIGNADGSITLGMPNGGANMLGTLNTMPAHTGFKPQKQLGSSIQAHIYPDGPPNYTALNGKPTIHIQDCIGKVLLINLAWYWVTGIVNLTHSATPSQPDPSDFGYELLRLFPFVSTGANSLYSWDNFAWETSGLNPTTAPLKAIYQCVIHCKSDNVYFNFGTYLNWSTGPGTSSYDFLILEVGPQPVIVEKYPL